MSDRFEISQTPLDGLICLKRNVLGDERGYFERMFCQTELSHMMSDCGIRQINHTQTQIKGAVRGMHYQNPPHAEVKFVSCLKGKIFDVAVDLRKDSPTFLKWHGEILSEDNHKTLVVPQGFAHGFQTMTENCEMLYFHTADYHKEAEAGLHPNDPVLNINWPVPIAQMSERDEGHVFLDETFLGVEI